MRRPTPFSAGGTRPGSHAKALRFSGGIPIPMAAVADMLPFDHRFTSGVIGWAPEDRRPDRRDAGRPSRRPSGRGLNPTATPGRPCVTANPGATLTFMSSPWGRSGDRGGTSISGRRTGRRRSICFGTPSTPNGWARSDDPARPGCRDPDIATTFRVARLRVALVWVRAALRRLRSVHMGNTRPPFGHVDNPSAISMNGPTDFPSTATPASCANGNPNRLRAAPLSAKS